MSKNNTIASDQRLCGSSNFTNWSKYIKIATQTFGIEGYLENDIIEKVSKEDFRIDLTQNDVFNNAVLKAISDVAGINPNSPLTKAYNALFELPSDGSSPSATTLANNAIKANNIVNQFFIKREILKIIKQNDSQALMIIFQNVSSTIMNEISRYSTCSKAYKKLKETYGNANTDMENWITTLKSLKAKNRGQIIGVLDKVKEIFTEMEEAKQEITNKEKLRYMFGTMPTGIRKQFNVTLEIKPDEFYKTVKERINALAYLEGTSEDNEIEDTDPMDLDFISKKKFRKESNERLKGKTNIQSKKPNYYCKICRKHGHSTEKCKFNGKTNGTYSQKQKGYNKSENKNEYHKKQNYHNQNNGRPKPKRD